jgi:outer membrane protein assembly factor BamB
MSQRPEGVEAAWSAVLAEPATLEDLRGVAVDPHGNTVAVGFRTDPDTFDPIAGFVAAFDRDGALRWRAELPQWADVVMPMGVAVDAKGNAYVTLVLGDADGEASALAKLDEEGELVWLRETARHATELLEFQGVALTRAGEPIVAGSLIHLTGSLRSSAADMVVRQYTSGGALAWASTYTADRRTRGFTVDVDADGHAHVAGLTRPGSSNAELQKGLVAEFDARGKLVRSQQLAQAGQRVILQDVALGPAGEAFLGGWTVDPARAPVFQPFLAKLDKRGEQVFFRSYATPTDGFTGGLAVDPRGNVVQPGTLASGDVLTSFVHGIDGASGDVRWALQTLNPRDDAEDVHSVAVDAEHGVYLAGSEFGEASGWDIRLAKLVDQEPRGRAG